jgi:hypothetical protein
MSQDCLACLSSAHEPAYGCDNDNSSDVIRDGDLALLEFVPGGCTVDATVARALQALLDCVREGRWAPAQAVSSGVVKAALQAGGGGADGDGATAAADVERIAAAACGVQPTAAVCAALRVLHAMACAAPRAMLASATAAAAPPSTSAFRVRAAQCSTPSSTAETRPHSSIVWDMHLWNPQTSHLTKQTQDTKHA